MVHQVTLIIYQVTLIIYQVTLMIYQVTLRIYQITMSLMIYQVIIHTQYSQSAGNHNNKIIGSSETTRENSSLSYQTLFISTPSLSYQTLFIPTPSLSDHNPSLLEYIPPLSVHIPTHKKPLSDDDFGFYLAGLIEGGGDIIISKDKIYILIKFNHPSTAYYIKSRLGFGSINKKTLTLKIVKLKGILKIIKLVNGKFRTNKIIKLFKLIEI